MNERSTRLSGDLPREFSNPVIDPTSPLRFTVDGIAVSGFTGDTVLSALIGSGVASAGRAEGSPLALDAASAPAVFVAGTEARPDLAMPMDICPALDGTHFVTAGAPVMGTRLPFARLFSGKSTLGRTYGPSDPQPGGWIDAAPTRSIATDVIVVGGGVTGLSAALSAAARGLRVAIIEREPVVGGLSALFGRAEGEPEPDDLIASLARQIGETGLVSLYLSTHAFDLDAMTVRAVRVATVGGVPTPDHLAITGNKLVLATGMAGRLPVFAGNRLPGVVDAATAWRLAARYNVWPGASAHIHTATNVGYRLALLGAASGKTIARTSDPRPAPQTRFIEFCKAYGYRLGFGATLAAIQPDRDGQNLVQLKDSHRGILADDPIACDRVIVSGGWQAELDLWLMAGGSVGWNGAHQRMDAQGTAPGVALAGSARGYQSLSGCAAHGRAVIAGLFDGSDDTVPDPRIDPAFETPDGALTVSTPHKRGLAPAWISPARAARLPQPLRQGLAARIVPGSEPARLTPAARTPLDLCGAVRTGLVGADAASRFARETCVLPMSLSAPQGPAAAPPTPAEPVPYYLEGRFGPSPEIWMLEVSTDRSLGPGCLVFLDEKQSSPLAAIGVVLSPPDHQPEALAVRGKLTSGGTVYIRDGLTAVAARVEKMQQGAGQP